MFAASTNCLILLMHDVFRAASRALANTGNRIAASIAMIAMTTSNSMRVNARLLRLMLFSPLTGWGRPAGRVRKVGPDASRGGSITGKLTDITSFGEMSDAG